MHAKLLQLCLTLCNPRDYSLPGSSVQGFSRQEYWSGLPFPSPGDLPRPRDQTQVSWQVLYYQHHLGSPYIYIYPLFFGFPSHLGCHRAPSACCVTLNKGLNLSEPVFSSVKWEAMCPYSHPCKLNPENAGESPGTQ